MGVRFVIGRSGSGKTAHFLRQTVAACRENPLGEPILWLVPRQATFLIERELCCGELGGFFRVQVMSIELLCRQVLAEVGPMGTEISSLGRQMILYRLLQQHRAELRYFKSVADKPGLAAQVAATLDELDHGGADAGAVATQLSEDREGNLPDKLADLAMIQRAYAVFLGEKRLDPQRRTNRAIESFADSRLLKDATVLVDGFLHFTHAERRVLAALGRVCPRLEISLTMDTNSPGLKSVHHVPDEMSLMHGMELEYRKLAFAFAKGGMSIDAPLLLEEPARFQTPALRQIEKWGGTSTTSDGLEMHEAPDRGTEVEIAARRAANWSRAGGGGASDIAVMARQIGQYQDLIEAIFPEHGIPYFVDGRRSAEHHPLIQLTRALLEAAADPWADEAILAIIKSGLCGLTGEQSDELENAVLLQDIRGEQWASEPLCASLAVVLQPFIARSKAPRPMRQWTQELLAVLQAFKVEQTISAWTQSADVERAREHQQVWSEFTKLLKQVEELLGDEEANLAEFQAVVNTALEQFDLAIAPATVDQVLVGQVDRTRTASIKACIVLGLADGQFPMPAEAGGILSDRDRRTIAAYSEVEPVKRQRAFDEAFIGYEAFTRPSNLLIVTRAISAERGEAIAAGSLWRKLRELFPGIKPSAASRPSETDAALVSTPGQLVCGLMNWARQTDSGAPSQWEELYQGLTGRPEADPTRRLFTRAAAALVYENKPTISAELTRQLFPTPLQADARQLESFAACPFQHFSRYGLKLRERASGEMSERDTARLCRKVLRLAAAGADDAHLRVLIADAARELRGDGAMRSARNRHLLERIAAMVEQSLAAQRSAQVHGDFRPDSKGIRYGPKQPMPPLKIGDQLLVSGFIDRVDRSPAGVTVHDYQMKTAALSLAEVYYGLTLRLVVHLLAWEQSGRGRAGAALASPLLREVQNGDPRDEITAEEFDLRGKPRGIIAGEFATLLDTELMPGSPSKVIAASINKNGEFGNLDKTDVVTAQNWRALLSHVRERLSGIAKQIAAGLIDVRPYRLGNETPCAHCGFADFCRFDSEEGYRNLQPMKRTAVLERIIHEGKA